jgi:hypothetical protein
MAKSRMPSAGDRRAVCWPSFWRCRRRAQERVDVALVLAVDVSRSMSFEELRIQREGYAAAIASPEVVRAIGQGAYRRIAITLFEWANNSHAREIVGWTVIESQADADRLRPCWRRTASASGAPRSPARSSMRPACCRPRPIGRPQGDRHFRRRAEQSGCSGRPRRATRRSLIRDSPSTVIPAADDDAQRASARSSISRISTATTRVV